MRFSSCDETNPNNQTSDSAPALVLCFFHCALSSIFSFKLCSRRTRMYLWIDFASIWNFGFVVVHAVSSVFHQTTHLVAEIRGFCVYEFITVMYRFTWFLTMNCGENPICCFLLSMRIVCMFLSTVWCVSASLKLFNFFDLLRKVFNELVFLLLLPFKADLNMKYVSIMQIELIKCTTKFKLQPVNQSGFCWSAYVTQCNLLYLLFLLDFLKQDIVV